MSSYDSAPPNERRPDTRPFLCIPYWTAPLAPGGMWDTGAVRPLPAAVPTYACESIHAGPYEPGKSLDVTVDIRNSGGGNAAVVAMIVLYWTAPSVGFAKPEFFAAGAVAIAPSRNAPATASVTMSATIPIWAPNHICLLASVSHAQDRVETVCNPVQFRHWAQRNLQAAPAAAGARLVFPIVAANPYDRPGAFELRVGPADPVRAQAVARTFDSAASEMPVRLTLLDERGNALSEETDEVRLAVDLGPLDQRQYQLVAEAGNDVPRGHSAIVEAGLHDREADRRGVGLVGSLGIALLPSGRG